MKPYYQDSAVTIYHGDCLEILPSINHVDLILTDPPYGVELEYESYDDSGNEWMRQMLRFVPLAKRKSDMVIMPSCRIKKLGFFYENFAPNWIICWHKGSPGTAAFVGFNDWEPLLVWGKTKGCVMHDYFSIPNGETMGGNGHPCPKPERWATWLLKRACPESGMVCDPFMGSGTTLRAAKDLGRKAIGIEIEEKYCEIAAQRMAQEVLPLEMVA
jgi:site-specific DNA-methyltransferase (adenine-specific)